MLVIASSVFASLGGDHQLDFRGKRQPRPPTELQWG